MIRRETRWLLRPFLLTLGVAGCAALLELPSETSTPRADASLLPDDGGATAPNDGATSLGDSVAPEADAGVPGVDASADTSVVGCQAFAGYALCDDFDDAATLDLARWTVEETDSGLLPPDASRINVSAPGVSAPYALRTSLPSLPEDAGLFKTAVVTTQRTAAKSVRVHATIGMPRVEGTYVNVLTVEFGSPYLGLSLVAFADGLHVIANDGITQALDRYVGAYDLRSPLSLELTVRLGADVHVDVRLDGTAPVLDAGAPTLAAGTYGGLFRVYTGIVQTAVARSGPPFSTGADSGTSVVVDDVVIWIDE